MNEAPGYMTYREAAIMFSLMQPDDAARAIKATVDYYLYGTVPTNLDGAAAQVFQIMHADIDRNAEKYQRTVERNRKNVQKRWEKGDTTGTRVGNQSNTNLKPKTLNYKQKPKHEGDVAGKPPRALRFTPPTVDEVRAYCTERKNRVDPERFVDFYSANGWKQGKGKTIVDWKAAVRTWEREDKAKQNQTQGKPADWTQEHPDWLDQSTWVCDVDGVYKPPSACTGVRT